MEIHILLLLVVVVTLVRYGHADNNNTGNDDHADDDQADDYYDVDNIFNPCENPDAFNVSASAMDPFVEGASFPCSELVMFQEMGVNASSTCESNMYVWGWGDNYPLGNFVAFVGGEGCCTDGVASCVDNGYGLGPEPQWEDDDQAADDNNNTGNDDHADDNEPFNPCAVPEDFLPNHSVSNEMTCAAWATSMIYGGIIEDSQCDEYIDGDDNVSDLSNSFYLAGCCGSGEDKCAGHDDAPELFNVCMNPDDFLPDFEFFLGIDKSTCGEYMGLLIHAGFDDSSSCSDVSDGLELSSVVYALHSYGCCGSVNDGARCTIADEPFMPCFNPAEFLADHSVSDNMTCGAWVTSMTYAGIVEDSQCGETINDLSVNEFSTSLVLAGCCSTLTWDKCDYDDDHDNDDFDPSFSFNPCEDESHFLVNATFLNPFDTTDTLECEGTLLGFQDMGITANSTCSSEFADWGWNSTHPAGNLMAVIAEGCCDGAAKCTDNGNGLGPSPMSDDDNDDDYADMWNPCGDVADFMPDALFNGPGGDDDDDNRRRLVAHAMSKMTMSPIKAPYSKMAARDHDDNGDPTPCGDMISYFHYAGVAQGDGCDTMIPDSDATLGMMAYFLHTSCCANPTTSAKTCEPTLNNYCANPDDFNSDVDISRLTGEEGTCEAFSAMMTFMGITSESDCNDLVMMGDDDYDDDDDDGSPNTVGEMYMMLSAFGCCSGNAHKCITPTYSLVGTYTKECGYPRNPTRRMHPNDMKTTLIGVDFSVNATGDVGIIFAADAEMNATDHVRIRVKALEFEFFAKTKGNKHMVHPVNLKRYREKFVHKFVEVHSMSDMVVMDRAVVEDMIPSVVDMGMEDMNFYRAPMNLGGFTHQNDFEESIRQARIEVQRKVGTDAPWQVDHCVKMPSQAYVANLMLQGGDDDYDDNSHNDDHDA